MDITVTLPQYSIIMLQFSCTSLFLITHFLVCKVYMASHLFQLIFQMHSLSRSIFISLLELKSLS